MCDENVVLSNDVAHGSRVLCRGNMQKVQQAQEMREQLMGDDRYVPILYVMDLVQML